MTSFSNFLVGYAHEKNQTANKKTSENEQIFQEEIYNRTEVTEL